MMHKNNINILHALRHIGALTGTPRITTKCNPVGVHSAATLYGVTNAAPALCTCTLM